MGAEQLNRKRLGWDLEAEYNEWAMARLNRVRTRSVEEWIERDRKMAKLRKKIRRSM